MRTTSENAQRAIADAALITFGNRGYGLATLEEIGAQVGLTRGAVLHHFRSKAGLLAAVVGPCRLALAQLVMTTPLSNPPTDDQRRQLLTSCADAFGVHRGALGLLLSDISARIQLGLDDQWFMPWERLVTLLVGSHADHLDRIRAAAAIGALIQPVSWTWVDLDNARTRGALIEAAVAVLAEASATGTAPSMVLGVAPQAVR